MLQNIGLPGLLILLFLVVLLFGAKKIPELFEGVAKGVKKVKEVQTEIEDSSKEEPKSETKKDV